VLFAYEARSEAEVSVAVGEVLTLISDADAEWTEVDAGDGRLGFVPAAYVELVGGGASTASSSSSSSSASSSSAAKTTSKSSGASAESAASKASRERTDRKKPPASASSASSSSSSSKSRPSAADTGTMRVLVAFAYEARSPAELTVRVDETLTVRNDDGTCGRGGSCA